MMLRILYDVLFPPSAAIYLFDLAQIVLDTIITGRAFWAMGKSNLLGGQNNLQPSPVSFFT